MENQATKKIHQKTTKNSSSNNNMQKSIVNPRIHCTVKPLVLPLPIRSPFPLDPQINKRCGHPKVKGGTEVQHDKIVK